MGGFRAVAAAFSIAVAAALASRRASAPAVRPRRSNRPFAGTRV